MPIKVTAKGKVRKKPRVELTPEVYADLVDAYREHPGNHMRAARVTGVCRHTSTKVWKSGVPSLSLLPIKTVIGEEHLDAKVRKRTADEILIDQRVKVEVRALKAAEEDLDTRIKAQKDAVHTMAREAKMVGLGRENIICGLEASADLLKAAMKEAETLKQDILRGKINFKPSEKMTFLRNCVSITRQLSEAAKLNMEMERLIAGEPTSIVGFRAENMTEKEAMRTLILAQRAVERAREYGQLTPEIEAAMMSVKDPDRVN